MYRAVPDPGGEIMKKIITVLILLLSMTFAIQPAIGGYGTFEYVDIYDVPDYGDNIKIAGHIPSGMDRDLSGYSGLAEIYQTRTYPYSAVAHMSVKAECGDSWRGTAFMAGNNVVLTAGHNLYCQRHQKWAEEITLYFGYRDMNNYAYKYSGSWKGYLGRRMSSNYDGYDRDYDWGYLILDSNVGDRTGWFGLSALDDSHLTSERYSIAGYPDTGSKPMVMKYDTGYIASVDNYVLNYPFSTLPGAGGAPVFDRDGFVVGINVSSDAGVRIRRQMIDKIREYGGILGADMNAPGSWPQPGFPPPPGPSSNMNYCPGAAGPRLTVGEYAYVCSYDGVWLKDKPGYGTLIHYLSPNTRLKVLSGPECIFYDGVDYKGERAGDQEYHYYWYVSVPATGETGWVPEGQDPICWYYLCPM